MTQWIPNEDGNRAVYATTDTASPTFPAPTFMLLGDLAITKTQDLVDKEEATGGYLRAVTPQLGLPTFAGTYGEDLTFESLSILARYAIKGGDGAVTDGNTTPGYDRTKAPAHKTDDIDAMAMQYGVDGLLWESRGVRFDEHTVTIDVDDADGVWKWSSNLTVTSKDNPTATVTTAVTSATTTVITVTGAAWTVNAFQGWYVFVKFGNHIEAVRKISSNTATTLTVDEAFSVAPSAADVIRIEPIGPVLSVPTYEPIPTYGTRIFLDDLSGTIGTTELIDRPISFNYTMATNRATKRFLNNPRNRVAAKTGRGATKISGSITLELDRRTEYVDWENLKQHKLRVEQIGSTIDTVAATTKRARLDFVDVAFGTPTEQARDNNMTVTVPFIAYGTASPFSVVTKTTLATLP